jgi:hypothetical protein
MGRKAGEREAEKWRQEALLHIYMQLVAITIKSVVSAEKPSIWGIVFVSRAGASGPTPPISPSARPAAVLLGVIRGGQLLRELSCNPDEMIVTTRMRVVGITVDLLAGSVGDA